MPERRGNGRAEAASTQAEIGWVLHPDRVGHGYATEAVEAVLRICCEQLGVRRVTAGCFAGNPASWKLMERVGMRREVHAVRDALLRSGEWMDSFGYALLAEEWATRHVSVLFVGSRLGMPRTAPGLARGMPTTSFDPHALLAASRLGVLATIKADGRPQLSPVMPYYDPQAGVIHVSMREGLAKTANLRRDPRATLEVTRSDGRAWVTAEGTATLTGPGTDSDGPEVEALVAYYRRAAGEHPDWDEYRRAMVADRRVLMTMTVDRVYGADIG